MAAQLERLVREGEAVLCSPVLAELLAGARTDTDAQALLDLTGLRFAEVAPPDVEALRRSGPRAP